MHALELIHEDLPALVDVICERNGWSWENLARGETALAGEKISLEALQWELVNNDPVLWAETHLVGRPEDGGGLWRLFPYQKPSARYRGHVVHQDGAEVGKSREIVLLILWTPLGEERGSCLVGSALDGDLDEIWDETEFQFASNPFLRESVAKRTTKPYRRIAFRNGLKVNFRPAGHDGRAYRGIHVGGLALHDEAAKVTNPISWSEFWRAGKPGCTFRLYSVPTGNRLCTFQRIADSAIPYERIAADETPRTIVDQIVRGHAIPEGAKALSRELGGRIWVRFHWPKTVMPSPFWDEQRRQDYVDMYGSADDPGYIHNVLGLPGDPEMSVFPERLLGPAIRHLPEYRTISLRWDSRQGRLDVSVRKLNPAYQEAAADPELADEDPEEAEGGGNTVEAMLQVYRDSIDVSDFDRWPSSRKHALIDDVVRCAVPSLEGFLTAGVDVGSTSFTEIGFERTARGRDALVLRISLTGFSWHTQRDLIRSLDDYLTPQGGWGFDATGVGKALVEILAGDGDDLSTRISGFVFNTSVPAINPANGDVLLDPQTGREQFISVKEQATQLLEAALSARTKDVPNDPELIFLLSNHTYSEPAGVRRYSKVNDHVADMWRCLALRHLVRTYGVPQEVPVTYAVPSDNAIDSMTIMKSF